MVDGCHEVLNASKSERTTADGLDVVIHSFDGSVQTRILVQGRIPSR